MENESVLYREFLKSKIAETQVAGKPISLRNLARKAKLSHGLLSQVLQGKRHLSLDSAHRIGSALGLETNEAAYFLNLVELEHATSESYRIEIMKRVQKRFPDRAVFALDLHSYELVANWYYFPIVELTSVLKGQLTPEAASKWLGITLFQAKVAIERLVELKILVEVDGIYRRGATYFHTSSPVPHTGIRRHHREMISKAIEAIEGQEIDQRYLSDLTIGLNREDVALLGEKIEAFKRELVDFVSERSGESADAVYQVNFQVFDLTDHHKEKRV